MSSRTIYLDTSVIGGVYDEEFMSETKRLFRLSKAGHFKLITSVVALEEIAGAPPKVRDFFAKTFSSDSLLSLTEESEGLAQSYIDYDIVPPRYLSDAQHVAICVVEGIDILASWNFKHLANLNRENAFNGVNLLQGYPHVRIVTPKALVYGFEENS